MTQNTRQIINDIAALNAKRLPKDVRLVLFGSQARGDATAELGLEHGNYTTDSRRAN